MNALVTVTRDAVVAEALSWIGTPFKHNQHCKRFGCDCIGLIIGVFQSLGCISADWAPPAYSPQWHAHKNEEKLVETALAMGCEETGTDELRLGDILIFKYGRVCSHAGFYVGDDAIVHAYFGLGRTVRMPLAGEMRLRHRKTLTAPWVEG